ncbi:RNB domain-containing ribonuclease [Miltoncostaea oceani]|uniref:RNB domain-containing ribonuclease n=1 Tax=Miltoncostaea oceani TaxID=2843216 RepID=UPI001C3E316D|nr:RNB domain-containing ribonuclease [Miltoncostaea oceani]
MPGDFPPEVEREAAAAAAASPASPGDGRADHRDLPLLTIDPEGSRDLDQAVAITRLGDGHRVHYAIADVAALVAPGGAVDAEARARGVTVYMPDRRSPLHPAAIGEGAGSLLPGEDRPALLWTIDLDAAGEPVAADLTRTVVRSRRAMSYAEAQAAIDAGGGDPTPALLREVGLARLAREAERGGVSLSVPVQEVVAQDDGGFGLRYETPLPVEDWNAQVSLLAGICAARIMIDGGVGLFRTLAPAEPRDLASLRRSARALGVPWAEGARYGDVVRALDPADPHHAAFAVRAARLFGGAAYTPWRREDGTEPPVHAAIAAVYAHVTAPLRRLADRFANEIVLAFCEGREPPAWAVAPLDEIAATMAATGQRERQAERAAIDLVEAAVLAPRVGESFPAVVTDVRDDRVTVQVADPAVVAPLEDGAATPGERISARLVTADPATRRVRFARGPG